MSITTLRDQHDFTKLNENLIDVTFNSIKTNDSLWFLKNVLIPVDSDIVELPSFNDIGVVMKTVLCAAKELYLKYKIISNYFILTCRVCRMIIEFTHTSPYER